MDVVKILLVMEKGKELPTRWKIIPRIGEHIIRNGMMHRVTSIHHDMDNDKIVVFLDEVASVMIGDKR